MDGAAGYFHSVVKSLIDCVKTREAREEARVQIENPSMKSIDEERTEDSHEASQDNQVRLVFFHGFDPSIFCILIELGIEWAGVQVTVFDIVALERS